MYDALRATAEFRKVELVPLSTVVDDPVELRHATYHATYLAFRRSVGSATDDLPTNFGTVVQAVTAFADLLMRPTTPATRWSALDRRWAAER